MLSQIVNSFREYYWQQVSSLDARRLLEEKDRQDKFSIKLDGDNAVFLDFSKENIDEEGLKFFEAVMKDRNVEAKKKAMFDGQNVNFTEDKPAFHIALRAGLESKDIGGVDVAKEIKEVRSKVAEITQEIRDGKRTGSTGKKFSCILNIGIGGSLLGLKSAYLALSGAKELAKREDILEMRFIANVDPADFVTQTKGINWESTLVVVSSKTFTTIETILNMNLVREQIVSSIQKIDSSLKADDIIAKQFLASTANPTNAAKAGIPEDSCFKFWDWVGGRFSVRKNNLGFKLMWNFAFGYRYGIRRGGSIPGWHEAYG
jgi:glucose-6-phosphate isomerase